MGLQLAVGVKSGKGKVDLVYEYPLEEITSKNRVLPQVGVGGLDIGAELLEEAESGKEKAVTLQIPARLGCIKK